MKVFFLSLIFCLCGAPPARAAASASDWQTDAAVAENAGSPHLAAHDLEQAKALSPQDIQVLENSARLLAETGHPRLATLRYQELLAADPGNTEAAQRLLELKLLPVLPEPLSPTTAAPLDPGQALWLDGDIRASVKTINTYNLTAPLRQRVLQAYVSSGQLILKPGRSRWALDLRPCQMAADTLSGDSRAMLWVQVDARGVKGLGDDDWQRLASELDTILKGDKRISGLLLEPQPASAALFPLYTALRRQLSLPVLVLVGSAQAVDFHYADVLVLRAWPRTGESLTSYQARINDQIAPFLRAGEQAQGKSMVALSGKLAVAGAAAPFFEAGRKALNANLDKAPTSYLGYSVHGLLPLADGTQTDLEPEVWRLLSLPVAGP
jgi:hypothetical protein